MAEELIASDSDCENQEEEPRFVQFLGLPVELQDLVVMSIEGPYLPDAMLVCRRWYMKIAPEWLCTDRLFWLLCDTNAIEPGTMMDWRLRSTRERDEKWQTLAEKEAVRIKAWTDAHPAIRQQPIHFEAQRVHEQTYISCQERFLLLRTISATLQLPIDDIVPVIHLINSALLEQDTEFRSFQESINEKRSDYELQPNYTEVDLARDLAKLEDKDTKLTVFSFVELSTVKDFEERRRNVSLDPIVKRKFDLIEANIKTLMQNIESVRMIFNESLVMVDASGRRLTAEEYPIEDIKSEWRERAASWQRSMWDPSWGICMSFTFPSGPEWWKQFCVYHYN